MARPREFDEDVVLDAAMQCFWSHGYEATSVRDLIEKTGIAGASLYNAFGDKQALFQKALGRYVEGGLFERMQRCESVEPYDAIVRFFHEILRRSLDDGEHRGCMLVNAALEASPRNPDFQKTIAAVLSQIEAFFLRCVEAGQASGAISQAQSAEDFARHLLGVLMGLRVLARVRPERALLEGLVRMALALLRVPPADSGAAIPGVSRP